MKNKGFTLVELLVAISIIATLTAIIVPNFMGARERARDSQKIQNLQALKNALRMYYNDHQSYPSGLNQSTVGPYMPTFDDFAASVPEGIEYFVGSNGDSFRAQLLLEAGAGDEDINSQNECWLDFDTDTTPQANVYAVCAK